MYYLLNEIRITNPIFYLQMTVKDCRTGIQERKNAAAPEARGTQINATKVRQVSKTHPDFHTEIFQSYSDNFKAKMDISFIC